MRKAITGTIVYGAACGAAFTPLWWVLGVFLGGHAAFLLLLWLFFAGYVALLSRWGRAGLASAVLPLSLCLVLALGNVSLLLFFCTCALTLAFLHARASRTRAGSLAADAVLFLLFLGMADAAAPYTAFQWALVIWLFFLVQSAHFLLVPGKDGDLALEKTGEDRFGAASRRAMEILDRQGI